MISIHPGARAAAVLLAGLIVLPLSACGGTKTTIKPETAAQSVANAVAKQTGFRPNDVHCPSGSEAKEGVEFECHFTGPEGKPYVAHMKVRRIDEADVQFDVTTNPS